jgi:hypothetical protein
MIATGLPLVKSIESGKADPRGIDALLYFVSYPLGTTRGGASAKQRRAEQSRAKRVVHSTSYPTRPSRSDKKKKRNHGSPGSICGLFRPRCPRLGLCGCPYPAFLAFLQSSLGLSCLGPRGLFLDWLGARMLGPARTSF